MILAGLSFVSVALSFLYVTLGIIVCYFGYKKLLKYVGKGETYITDEKYVSLDTLEKDPARGELEFYFVCSEAKALEFAILDSNLVQIESVVSKEFSEGGHILRYDSTRLSNGKYFYQIKTDNQNIRKQMLVKN